VTQDPDLGARAGGEPDNRRLRGCWAGRRRGPPRAHRAGSHGDGEAPRPLDRAV